MDIQAYKEAIEFMKNKHSKEPMQQGISNLYVIRRIDKDGNVLETKFGENLMTDYGFRRHFVENVSWPSRVYVGDGIPSGGYFSQDSKVLQNLISDTALTNSNTTKDYDCPFYYDAASSSTERGGLITVFCQYLVCYMNYSNSTYGIADNTKLIYEFGIGEDSSNLWTHSRVYTSAGSPSHVAKNNGERLEFTIFLCLSYYESMIMNGWNDAGHVDGQYGRYTVITTPERMFQKMVPSNIYTFQRDSQNNVSIAFTNSSTSIEETYITNTQLINAFTSETISGDGKIKTANGYIDGFISDSPGMCIVEREEMDHFEDIDMIIHPSTPYSDGFSAAFGVRDKYRFTQLQNITTVAMFDYITGTWINDSVFVNEPNKWYDETPLLPAFGKPICYMSNNTVQKLYVHQNINQLDGITAITSGNLIVYMASKYWDTSTWVNIQDLLHIPPEYKHYKYILTADNAVALKVERELSGFAITPKSGNVKTTYAFDKVSGIVFRCDNYDFGWYKGDTTVYVPDTLIKYTTSSKYSMTWDKWLINFNTNSTITVYDMTNVVSQHPVSLTSYSVTPAFATTVSNIVSGTYRTESKTGLICLFNKANSQAVVIDLTTWNGTTFTTNECISGCVMACCITNTRKIAYIPSNATDTIIIYDYDTHQIFTTLSLPSLPNPPSIIIGMNKYVWFSDASAPNTYYINIENGSYEKCDTYIPWDSSSSYGNFFCSSTNNFFVGYNCEQTMNSHSQAFVVRADAPKQVRSLADLRCTDGYYPGWDNLQITLRNVETNTSDHTCAMIMSGTVRYNGSGTLNIIVDLGYYYANPDNSIGLDNVYNDNGENWTQNRYGTIIPYGQFIMIDNNTKTPLEYAMPHKLVAKTRTITTQNSYKNIANKSWSTTFTNTPKFHGLPPGNMATL